MLMNNIKFLSVIVVFSICTMASALTVNLKNNTYNWNIKYRTTFAQDPGQAEEKLLKPGEEARVSASSISIRRSGFGSSVISSWTDVPLAKLLAEHKSLTYGLATIEISTGLTGGWSFNVAKPNKQ
jgi:hypothetical protein